MTKNSVKNTLKLEELVDSINKVLRTPYSSQTTKLAKTKIALEFCVEIVTGLTIDKQTEGLRRDAKNTKKTLSWLHR